MSDPKIDVIITSYNYSNYIKEAIYSVLNQSYSNINLIVIDDGSTDSTKDVLKEFDNLNYKIKIVCKKNKGQLSCFNVAINHLKGDFIFFLDADDFYQSNYIEKALNFFKKNNECDFLFSDRIFVDKDSQVLFEQKKDQFSFLQKKVHYGLSTALTFFTRLWIGSSTSTISMKRGLYEAIIPLPFENDWKVRADDCLVWGASLKGGYKCFLDMKLVNYRVHGGNLYHGKSLTNLELCRREYSIGKLFSYLTKEYRYQHILKSLPAEFKYLPEPRLNDFKLYTFAVMMENMSILKKIKYIMKLFKNYLRL